MWAGGGGAVCCVNLRLYGDYAFLKGKMILFIVNAVPHLQESSRSVPTLLGRCRSLEKDRET